MAKPSGDHTPLGGFVSIMAIGIGRAMNRKNKHPIATPTKPDRPVGPGDLAERFRELKRLRKEVEDLETLAKHDGREVQADPTVKRRE